MAWSALLQFEKPIYDSKSNTCLYRVNTSNKYGVGVIVKQIQCASAAEAQKTEEQGRIPHCHPHPHICECLGWEQEPIPGSSGYYVYTFWPPMSESLHDDLSRRVAGETWTFYTEDELWRIYRQLLGGFSYLQECNIVHRDIKLKTILKDLEGNWRIFDFRCTREINPNSPTAETLLGTKPYVAPALRKACIEYKNKPVIGILHDVYRSDVYSLGLVLLHLSLLELPVNLTQLLKLQQLIDTILDELTNRYSEQWVDVLKRMLKVEEDQRPDFKLLQSTSTYDDECLQSSSTLLGEPLQFSLKCGLESVRVSQQHVDEVPCMLTVQAGGERSYALDLVCVVDQSGSVDESTLEFVKSALLALLKKLSDQDRFSLVCFSDTAERKCPLVRCNADGKKRISAHINILQTQDLTNMTAGFKLGIKILQERKYRNRASTLLLFTDEQSNVGDSPSRTCQQALADSELERFTVNCFALGENMNFPLLEEIASLSGGKYCRLTSADQIANVVAGSLHSMVARDLRVKWEALESKVQCEVSKVYSQTRISEFSLPSISTNERIDLIFLVKPRYGILKSPERCPTIQAELIYTDNEDVSSSKLAILDIKFVKWGNVPSQQDTEIYLKRHRAQGTECLQEAERLLNEGMLEQAKEYVRGAIDVIQEQYASDEEVAAILSQLRQVSDRLVAQ